MDGGGAEGLVVGMLEIIYDKVEDRHGRSAAWFVTILLTLGLIAGATAILMWLV